MTVNFDLKKITKKTPFTALEKPKEPAVKSVVPKPPRDWQPLKNRLAALGERAQGLLLLPAAVLPFLSGIFSYQAMQAWWIALAAGFIWLSAGRHVFLVKEWRLARARLPRLWSLGLFLLAAWLFLGKALSGAGLAPDKLAILAGIIILFLLCFKNYPPKKIKIFIAAYFILESLAAIFFLFFSFGAMAESGVWLIFIINFILLFAWAWSREGMAKLFWALAAFLRLAVILWWWSVRDGGMAFWTLPVWAYLIGLAGIYLSWPARDDGGVLVVKTNGAIARQMSFLVFLAATAFLIYSIILL